MPAASFATLSLKVLSILNRVQDSNASTQRRRSVPSSASAMSDKDDESLFNVINLPSEYEKSNFFGKFVYLLSIDFSFFFNFLLSIELPIVTDLTLQFSSPIQLIRLSVFFSQRWQWRFYLRNYRNTQIKLKDIPSRRKGDDAHRIYRDFEKYDRIGWVTQLMG